jgi:hypothetical protein
MLPAACSLIAVVIWRRTFRRFVALSIADIAGIVLVTSYGFLAYADTLYFHSYAFLTTAAAVACFVRAMSPDESRQVRWLLFCACFVFAGALFTWEYHLWLIFFMTCYVAFFPRTVRWSMLLLPVVPIFIAAGLHSLQRQAASRALGLSGVTDDPFTSTIFYSIYLRTIDFAGAMDTPPGLTLAGYPRHLMLCFYRFYGVPVIALLAMIILALAMYGIRMGRGQNDSRGARLLICLIVAGLGWPAIFMQHSSVHLQVMRHSLPAYSLLMGILIVNCWTSLRRSDNSMGYRIAAATLLGAMIYPQAEGAICAARTRLDDIYVDARGRTDTGPQEGRILSQLNEIIPPGAVILTNLNRTMPMRLWSRKPTYETQYRHSQKVATQGARSALELSLNHLRDLYRDRLPPIYYVYFLADDDLHATVQRSNHLRFLLTGDGDAPGPVAWEKARPALEEAQAVGHSDKSFCPIRATLPRLICFDFTPAMPLLLKAFEHFGVPTLQQFEGLK